MRSMLVVAAWTVAAAIQPALQPRRAALTSPRAVACQATSSNDIEGVVAQQAKEIAALRRMVEELRSDREDQQAAKTPDKRGRPPKRAVGQPRTPVYKLFGSLPDGFDAAPIERLIARRVRARLKKHYSEADRLQNRILRMGVKLNDRQRTWSLQRGWEAKQRELAAEDELGWKQQQMLQAELEKKIKRLFAYWDQDGNGLIDRSEFRLALQVLDIPGGTKVYDETFDAWDTDGNGGLNFKEIRAALIELQQKHGPGLLATADQTVDFLGAEGAVGDTVRDDFAYGKWVSGVDG